MRSHTIFAGTTLLLARFASAAPQRVVELIHVGNQEANAVHVRGTQWVTSLHALRGRHRATMQTGVDALECNATAVDPAYDLAVLACNNTDGLIRHPHDAWIQQVARNLTDSVDGFQRGKRCLIHGTNSGPHGDVHIQPGKV